MPKFAHFDAAAEQPTPVLGWYDTDAHDYRDTLPHESGMLALSPEQWARRMDTPYVSGGTLSEGPSLVKEHGPTGLGLLEKRVAGLEERVAALLAKA